MATTTVIVKTWLSTLRIDASRCQTSGSRKLLLSEKESKFRSAYSAGMAREDYWEPTLEDSLDLIAKLPAIAAGIYRMRFRKGERIPPRKDLDWSRNYAHMLGIEAVIGTQEPCVDHQPDGLLCVAGEERIDHGPERSHLVVGPPFEG